LDSRATTQSAAPRKQNGRAPALRAVTLLLLLPCGSCQFGFARLYTRV
jgi:hypothetical protein